MYHLLFVVYNIIVIIVTIITVILIKTFGFVALQN